MPRKRVFDVTVQARNLAQEGAGVIAERVLDLVFHRQALEADHAGLPQLGDAGADQGLVLFQLALGVQLVALGDQFGNGPLGIQNAFALHFGRVGRQYGRDPRLFQGLGDVLGAQVGGVQTLQRQAERAFLLVALAFVEMAAPHMVAVFGQVGQVREIAEGADDGDGLVTAEVLEQAVQRLAGVGILFQAKRHRQLAHPLDQLVGLAPLVLTQGVAQDPAQQANVVSQRSVFLRFGRASRLT